MGHREDSIRFAKIGLIASTSAALAGAVLVAIGPRPTFGAIFIVVGIALFAVNYRILRKMRRPR